MMPFCWFIDFAIRYLQLSTCNEPPEHVVAVALSPCVLMSEMICAAWLIFSHRNPSLNVSCAAPYMGVCILSVFLQYYNIGICELTFSANKTESRCRDPLCFVGIRNVLTSSALLRVLTWSSVLYSLTFEEVVMCHWVRDGQVLFGRHNHELLS